METMTPRLSMHEIAILKAEYDRTDAAMLAAAAACGAVCAVAHADLAIATAAYRAAYRAYLAAGPR